MSDPNILTTAPSVASLLDSASGSREGLRDRGPRSDAGTCGRQPAWTPVEGWNHREIERSYYEA